VTEVKEYHNNMDGRRLIMKKFLKPTRTMTLVLAAMLMFSGMMTVHAALLLPGMTQTEDGRIKIEPGYGGTKLACDQNGRQWFEYYYGYPYCEYKEAYEMDKIWGTVTYYNSYLDCYLGDYIKTHDESQWPYFVIKGSDGVPFYYSQFAPDLLNYVSNDPKDGIYWCKYCYDEASGWWVYDKSYKEAFISTWTGTQDIELDDLIKKTKADIENGKTINGKAKDPLPPTLGDKVIDTDNPPEKGDDEPSKPVNPPAEITDPYADVNTLGAAVTLKTDCIKVKKNNAPQKPMPKSVKIGKTSLKKNKTFTVSYEKYENGWNTVDAVTGEGIYRLVVTGQNGYEGICTKRLYVTSDKAIKAMSSVSVKVNKMSYTCEPITSGVIKTAKIGGRTLTEGTDYTVAYANNTEIGTAQVILTAKEGSGLLGTKTVNFSIKGNPMSKVKVKGLSSVVYNPNTDLMQNMSNVTLTYGKDVLKENTDFTVAYANNTKAGTAKIVFTGKGRYNGMLKKTFKITKAPLSESMLDDASKNMKEAFTGKAVKPDVTLKYGDTVLKKGTDYTLAYSNNVKVSTDIKPAQITVKGKGNYAGSFKVSFAIISNIDDNGKAKTINNEAATESAMNDETTVNEESAAEEFISEEESLLEETTEVTEEAAEVTEEVTEVTQEVTEETEEAAEVTEEVTEETEEAAEVTQEVTEMIEEVTEVTQEVTEVTKEVTEETEEATEVTEEVTEVTQEATEVTQEVIEEIEETIETIEAIEEVTEITKEEVRHL